MKLIVPSEQRRRSRGSGRASSSLFARPAIHRADSSRQHRPSPQVVRDRQEREVQGVLLQPLVTTPRQRTSRLPVGEDALHPRAHRRPAMIERIPTRRQSAAARVEADARQYPGPAQTFPSVGVAVGRVSVDRRCGRAIDQAIRRHAVVHRAGSGLDGAHDRAAVVHRDARL